MINGINIILNDSYPSIEGLRPNKDLAYKIMKSYAGQVSELTCTHNYIYQHLIISDSLPEIKNALKKIAIVEMKHLEILGEMIKKLGLLPVYTYLNKQENENYWDSSLVNYESDLYKIINNNIKNEEKAIKGYQKIIKDANDEIVTDILNRIIYDEEHHIKIFKSILDNMI